MKERCGWAIGELDIEYHDKEWGVPVFSDQKLFEFLTLEGMQAGLSWSTILKKREDMRRLFSNFNPYEICNYDSDYIDELMKDKRIVRNRLKLNSMVNNAKKLIEIVEEYGSFSDYIWNFVGNKPIVNRFSYLSEVPVRTELSDLMSQALKKRGFKFVGSTICYAFMQAVGMVNDHLECCFRHSEVLMEGKMSRKVIDAHVHVGEVDKLRDDIKELLMMNEENRDFNIYDLFSNPDTLGEYLKSCGVEHAILLGEEGPATNFHITSEYVLSYKQRASLEYRGMFTCLGSMNPNRTSKVIEKYHSDKTSGIMGYKLYPSDHNFNPLSGSMMELYSHLEKDRKLLMFHTGETAQKDAISEYQDPQELEEIVRRFPNLKIVFCHGGKLKYASKVRSLLDKYENLYVDTGFISAETIQKMFPDIEKYSKRILFASDMPGGVKSLSKLIASYEEMNISNDAINDILYFNMKEILSWMGVEV